MDALKKLWINKTHDAILQIERYLGIVGEQCTDFSKLANWIYATEFNLHGFMPAGCEGVKESAQDFSQFLHMLHLNMIDDGSLIFIETDTQGSYMIFGVDEHEEDKIQEIDDKRFRMNYRRPYRVHRDVTRFIEHFEAYELYSAGRDERHAARMQALSESNKP
jgi:hypothetical protein